MRRRNFRRRQRSCARRSSSARRIRHDYTTDPRSPARRRHRHRGACAGQGHVRRRRESRCRRELRHHARLHGGFAEAHRRGAGGGAHEGDRHLLRGRGRGDVRHGRDDGRWQGNAAESAARHVDRRRRDVPPEEGRLDGGPRGCAALVQGHPTADQLFHSQGNQTVTRGRHCRIAALAILALSCPTVAVPALAQSVTATFFIASDCPISNAYAPEISGICKAYAAKGVSCTLAYEDAKIAGDALQRHLGEYQLLGMTATWDKDRKLADRAHVTITPTAVITDSRGGIRYEGRIDNLYINIGRTRQQVTSHDVADALDAVLAGKPVRQSRTEALGCYIERNGS